MVNLLQLLWKTVWWFLKELKTESPDNPAILLLGIAQEKQKHICQETCTQMSVASLCITAKKVEQPECPSTDD
jgi:hypothetical protein